MRHTSLLLAVILCVALVGCGDDSDGGAPSGGPSDSGADGVDGGAPDGGSPACDSEPVLRTTSAGVEFVRTPDSCFESLPGWDYEPRYVEIDELRQAYVDEGSPDGPVVLLLHGQPSWSYLYRKMIPVLADAGFRVIAMDHLGMGRSDKPVDIAAYSYLGHNDRLLRFIEQLDLRDVNLFVQDWGSLIGLRVAGLHPDRFARIAVGDGMLPTLPEGVQPFPVVEDPNEIEDISPIFADLPAQQVPFYDGCARLLELDGSYFGEWMEYALKGASFRASEVVEAMTWFDLPPAVEAAYDAPFPSRTYMAGPRIFPSLVNEVPGQTAEAWAGLSSFERPFLAIWAANDPGNLGSCEVQQLLVDSIPGAAGQPHDRLAEASHFLQDDQGAAIAQRLVPFYSDRSSRADETGRGVRYCEIILGYVSDGEVRTEVWGTQGLNLCPAQQWDALDPASVQAEHGADFILWNGPRYGVMDEGNLTPPDGEPRLFGDLELQLVASIVLDPADLVGAGPYTERTVERATHFEFWSGFEAFQLTAPDGSVYLMQSMSQTVDPELTMGDLPDLGSRLELPPGWTYEASRRITDLVVITEREVTVLQDDLDNTYTRISERSAADAPPILEDGTGTPCSDDDDCQDLDAAHCLVASGPGMCTVEGCQSGECGAPYLCCFDCNPAAAPLLPFEGSACLPEAMTGILTGQAGCTCD